VNKLKILYAQTQHTIDFVESVNFATGTHTHIKLGEVFQSLYMVHLVRLKAISRQFRMELLAILLILYFTRGEK
jgi:hypothetical protein